MAQSIVKKANENSLKQARGNTQVATNSKDKAKEKCFKYKTNPNLWFSGTKTNAKCSGKFKEEKLILEAAKENQQKEIFYRCN